ncbi:MAG: alpha-galactosidase [Bacteroidota bacterium]|nr:alpha-galactosidase [Bacteroidota bacterium]
MNINKVTLLFFISCLFFKTIATAQLSQCKVVLKNDTLTLENSKIRRIFLWNEGGLQSIQIYNKISNKLISGAVTDKKADMIFPGLENQPSGGSLHVYNVSATNSGYAYTAAEITARIGTAELKRVFKIYAGCPAIACDYYVRGKPGAWDSVDLKDKSYHNIEDENSKKNAEGKTFITDKIIINGNNWHAKSVEFFDATDYNNNLVQEYNRIIYRQENRIRGNLLFAENLLTKAGLFILKEAPTSNMQLQYAGYDFTTQWGQIKVAGIGIAPTDISDSEWIKGYSVVVGVSEGEGETGLRKSLRHYQDEQCKYEEERDGMIVSNTWGDRNRDSRINEAFILKEIDAAAKLGVTRLQIDDGWQVGKSSNSANGGSLTNIWRNKNYWNVDAIKFPDGLSSVIDAAKNKGIQISLWFNPSNDSSLKYWEKDADVLIDQYKKYGISMWKIDGVQVTDKRGEINYRKFLDKVEAATNYEAVFNVDITAGRRFGFNYLNTYGNFYLENRYTDWTNYYPYYTLRNLWQLSAYMPPQRFQIEFLNKWRNAEKYPGGDILAPSNYSFDYLFAITMVAQPLAFMEVSGLPAEAFTTSKLISKYKLIKADLHRGDIFPIGEEPDGFSWTGFQSIQNKRGYILLFRENDDKNNNTINTILPRNAKIKLELIAGDGKNFDTTTSEDGHIIFEIDKKNSFSLYRYTLN